jgi:phospholipid/cholesterol/gamma-HCH transport system permease protein
LAGFNRKDTVMTKGTETLAPPGIKTAALAPKLGKKLQGVTGGAADALAQAGGMAQLLGSSVTSAVIKPLGYWGDVREQMIEALKRAWMPLMLSTITFGFGAPGLQGGNIFLLFGIPERLGSFFLLASVREFAPFINAMVVAGVMGTAITADLGSRRIREEFDAMEILGVDPVRSIILPRIIAVTFMTGLLDVVALCFGILGGYLAEIELGGNTSAYFQNFWANATTTDMWGSVIKSTIFGLFIGVVCCYKGYRAEGGPVGVGRAVNHAVVISFALIFIVNITFTAVLLGLNPDISVYR